MFIFYNIVRQFYNKRQKKYLTIFADKNIRFLELFINYMIVSYYIIYNIIIDIKRLYY